MRGARHAALSRSALTRGGDRSDEVGIITGSPQICVLTDTLIADGDGLYHPSDFNDRLVLGLKGTMSEAELHLIRHRLTAGLLHKAAKGELRQGLPVGFDYDQADNVVMTPDEAVREAIATVFRLFDELGSGRQVMLTMHGEGVLIPRRANGSRRIRWAKPSYPAIHDFLTNPAYAGAFVFGRTRVQKRLDEGGRLVVRTRQVPRAEWTVLIPDHHPGFISWERYVANQDALRANWHPNRGEGGGAVREGTALLQGLIRCGRCGRKMQIAYSGPGGNTPRYLCGAARALYQPGSACQSLGGRRLEQQVLTEVFAVLEPAALAATAKAINEAETLHAQLLAVFELAVERARFDADRARRQFDACEPENRLVGRNLERTWEQALGRLRQAEADLAAQRARRPTALSPDELDWVSRAGADVRAIFEAASTTDRERKQLLRAVIAEVVVTTDTQARTAAVRIIWEGGATTSLTMNLNKTGGHFRATSADTVPACDGASSCAITTLTGVVHNSTSPPSANPTSASGPSRKKNIASSGVDPSMDTRISLRPPKRSARFPPANPPSAPKARYNDKA